MLSLDRLLSPFTRFPEVLGVRKGSHLCINGLTVIF